MTPPWSRRRCDPAAEGDDLAVQGTKRRLVVRMVGSHETFRLELVFGSDAGRGVQGAVPRRPSR